MFGLGPDRIGRVLKWQEGRGYVVSDLSSRGMRVGFPHVCSIDVAPLGEHTSRLTIGARGRWTATWWPRPLVRLWLWWVLRSTEGRVMALALSRRTRLRRGVGGGARFAHDVA